MKKRIILLLILITLVVAVGLTKITLRVEGEVHLTCEDSIAILPFKRSVSTRVFGVINAKKMSEEKAESVMNSFEKMLSGVTAEYEINSIKLAE